jgi:hypothetical protein
LKVGPATTVLPNQTDFDGDALKRAQFEFECATRKSQFTWSRNLKQIFGAFHRRFSAETSLIAKTSKCSFSAGIDPKSDLSGDSECPKRLVYRH